MTIDKIDNREVAEKNELRILAAICRCAYLRAKDIASLIWPESSPGSGQRMAQRTLARLHKQKELLRAVGPASAVLHALSEAGATRLGSECNIAAKSGKDALRSIGNFFHRCMCNIAFIQCELANKRPNYTEHEILTERGSIFQWHAKKPDLMVFTDAESGRGWWWIEVEHSVRNAKEMQRLSMWLQSAIHAPVASGHDIEIGTNSEVLLLGVVLLFETESELEKLKERTRSAVATWIDPLCSVADASSGGRSNKAALFLSDHVHFVLLSEFAFWLNMTNPCIYSTEYIRSDENTAMGKGVANGLVSYDNGITPERPMTEGVRQQL